jgi:hypothetical protein
VKKSIHFLLIILAFCSCHTLSPSHVCIDNPSNYALTILIDSASYKIEGKGSVEILLSKGNYKIKILNDSAEQQPIITETISVQEDGILNVCKVDYILMQQVYAKLPLATQVEKQHQEVALDNYTYNGPIKKMGKGLLFIPKIWDKGLNEAFNTSENIQSKQKVISKIFRCNEFETDFLKNTQ